MEGTSASPKSSLLPVPNPLAMTGEAESVSLRFVSGFGQMASSGQWHVSGQGKNKGFTSVDTIVYFSATGLM